MQPAARLAATGEQSLGGAPPATVSAFARALDAVAAYDWATVARDVLSVYETVVLGRATVGIAQ